MKQSPESLELASQQVSRDVLLEKYAKGGETSIEDIRQRVATVLASVESDPDYWRERFYNALATGFIPAGRINSAAGTDLCATLINCFVQPVGDSITETSNDKPGIYTALAEAAETMRRGGGVGYDFSAIRPKGAFVRGTSSRASGPISYMRVFDRSCETVESAGSRRGAQMGVLRCDHPNVEEFVHAKDKAGELTNFNISVAVTDEFMRAVEADSDFELVHRVEPGADLKAAGAYQRDDGLWVYRTINARQLWADITASTYDHAEPGVLFIDRMNSDNNLHYCEVIEATNPCVTADTWVMTSNGPRQVADLVGQPFEAIVDGQSYTTGAEGFFATGSKPVLSIFTKSGYRLRLTANHRVRRVTRKTRYLCESEWTPAGDLQPNDEILLHDHRSLPNWGGDGTHEEGYLLGLLLGDGTLKSDKAVLSVWANAANNANGTETVNGIMQSAEAAARTLPSRSDFKGWQRVINGRGEHRLSLAAVKKLALKFGMRPGNKSITPSLEQGSRELYRGFLQGLFDADGSVQGTQVKGVSIRLTQSNLNTLEAVQRMLHRIGIVSAIYRNRHPKRLVDMPDGQGGKKAYSTSATHELVIAGANISRFAETINFSDTDKQKRLGELLGNYNRQLNKERFTASIDSIQNDGVEEVFDVRVPGINAFDANSLYVHNCGEQPLPSYGCCCLGSINLTCFVRQPFTAEAHFDFDAFAQVVEPATRMLDNVLDVTVWPLPQQKTEADNKRRIGLGFTGLGDTLAMLGLRYDTQQARDMAAGIAGHMRDTAYRTSIELARDKGSFPLFDADRYLASGFTQRLPEDIRDAIREHGIRNSHLLSIAPTGTISLAFADNASNGIEPPFSWTYRRIKRMPDDSTRVYTVEDHAYRLYRQGGGDVNNLPPAFVTALEISALDHMRMLQAVQPFVDTSISKTVNVPEDYNFDDFRDLYLEAWHSDLKGLATFRPNTITGAVLQTGTDNAEAAEDEKTQPQDFDESDPDRRISLEQIPKPALASLRWPGRPTLPNGNPAWTYMIEHPNGAKFALFVGHIENGETGGGDGRVYPFEVWVNGAEQPRGMGAMAKTLSMDMRTNDRAWLQYKLESLMKASGDDAFSLAMPPEGNPRWVPSLVSAVATLVNYRLQELGVFDAETGETPVLSALMSPKEPKTGTDGTMSWTVDINNPATNDDFVLGLKELVLPGGQRCPYSVWLSGEYPRSLDGLCKILSFDMRVVDPAWIGAKLRKLLSYPEPQGDFLAWVPGAKRQQSWPSTIAYMARLIIHRYAMLGILDEEGYPVEPMGILDLPEGVVPLQRAAGAQEVMPGKRCTGCGAYAVIRKDGCDFCTACGELGACG